jgi:CRISPR-associated endonuclease/helicase Cas3
MIESGMVPVIVATEKRAREITSWIDIDSIASGRIARELQRFIVQIPPRARDLLIGHGHVEFRNRELRGEQFAVLAAEELYADDTGLVWENPGYLAVEKLIW